MVGEPNRPSSPVVIGITITNPKSHVLVRVNEDAILLWYEDV
jgi:hypothetical protein